MNPPASAPSRSTSSRWRDLSWIALGLAVLLLPHLGRRALWEPDEARYSEIPREMLASGDFVTPRLNDVKYFEKPPLVYWLEAGAMKLFGPGEGALRLPLALLALLGLAGVYFVGRELFGRRAALLAAAVLGTSPLYLGLGHVLTLDLPVSVFLTLALLAFLNATTKGPGWERRLWLWGFFAAAALATLSKGLIGIVIPAMVVVPWILWTRRWRAIGMALQPSGIFLFLAIAAPWHLLASQANPEFAWFYFVHEHFQRYLTKTHHRYEPPWYFLPVLLGGMLPWSAFLPQAVLSVFRKTPASNGTAATTPNRRDEALFLLLWAGLVFAFFSLSDSKLIPYILPCLPPLALLIGRVLAEIWDGERCLSQVSAGAVLLFALPLGVAILVPTLPLHGKAALYAEMLGGYRYAFGASLVLLGVVPFLLARTGRTRAAIAAYAVTGGIFLTTILAPLPRFDALRSARGLAEMLAPRLQPGDEVLVYHDYLQGLPLYLKRKVTIVDYLTELEFGVTSEPATRAWMIDEGEFEARWNRPTPAYAVVDSKYPKRVAAIQGEILGQSGPYRIVMNAAASRAAALARPMAPPGS